MNPHGNILSLPKWAREHIENLSNQLGQAKAQIKRMEDSQTPSPVWVDDWMGIGRRKQFVQAPMGCVVFEHNGIHLEVFLVPDGDGQREHGIEITYSSLTDTGHRGRSCAAIPHNAGFTIVHKNHIP